MTPWLVALVGLLACSEPLDCSLPETVVARDGSALLLCSDVATVVEWVRLDAARPLRVGDEDRVSDALIAAWAGHGAEIRGRIDAATVALAAQRERTGLDAARARAHAIFATQAGQGPFDASSGDLFAVWQGAVHVWATHAGDGLAIGEADLEGWLRVASLCREVQGGGALRLSVADRVTVYRTITDRFASGSTDDRVALSAAGAFLGGIEAAWRAAPYEQQQLFVQGAPLPPPMTATSLGYVETVLTGDVAGTIRALHQVLGPLRIDRP